MRRLAWFTPLPPERSGIAAYSVEILDLLARDHELDVFVDTPPAAHALPRTGVSVWSAHDFLWKHGRHPYDLVVYQLGNAICHDYMWAYLFRYPGLVVLHDGQLHHARARLLHQQRRHNDYRAEFLYNHPDARPQIADLGIAGLLGSLHYFWPMVGTVVRSARLVAVHNRVLARDLGAQFPGARIERLRMGVPGPGSDVDGQAVRQRHGFQSDTTLFAAFGRITPEKRVSQALRALARVAETTPQVHLLLVGEPARYYDAAAEARALGVDDRVTLTGFVDEASLASYVAAADVCLCMRWPTSRETSASWLRCLAAGKPTIVTDLSHTIDIPALVTRGTWAPAPTPEAGAPADPICVSIDILDEDDSLHVAMHRLARDARLRARLGERARSFWAHNHTLEQMAADYRRLITLGADTRAPVVDLPWHLRADGTEVARAIARDLGVSADNLHPLSTR